MIDEGLLFMAVDYGRTLGASYVEARYHSVLGFGLTSRNGEIIGMWHEQNSGIGVRVLVEGSLGFAATNIMTKGAVKRAVEDAFRKAKSGASAMREPIKFSDEMVGRAHYSVLLKKDPGGIDVGEKVRLHVDSWRRAVEGVKEVKIVSGMLNYQESVEEKIITNSDGAFVMSTVPRISAFYNLVALHPQRGVLQFMEELGASGGYEWVEKWDIVGRFSENAEKLEKILVEARKPPTDGPIDVVLGSNVVGLMVHESCGHPSEADRILGREAAQAGKSFMEPGMIGERIGSDVVTVIDDPTLPGSFGFYLYDDEGVPARPRYLYLNGRINEHLHNRWSAAVYGVKSNAAARARNYASEPIVRMANTYFAPGDHTFEELIEDIKLGVYIKNYMEWNIDDRRWGQRYTGLEAYLIEDGELKGYVANPVVEFTTKEVYTKIDAADRNLEFYAGMCGKGEPMQGIPVWMGGPNVRVRGLRVGVAPR